MKKFLITIILLALTAFITAQNKSTDTGTKITFTATDINGKEITSEIFEKNKVTMLNIWGTFCQPCLVELPDFILFAHKGLDHANAVDVAAQRAVEIVGALEHFLEQRHSLFAQHDQDQRDRRDRGIEDARHGAADIQRVFQRHDQRERAFDEDHDDVGKQRLDARGIGDHARDERADLDLIDVFKGKILNLVEQRRTHIGAKAHRGDGRAARRDVADDQRQKAEAEHFQQLHVQRVHGKIGRVGKVDVVHQVAHDLYELQTDHNVHEHHHRRHEREDPIALDKTEIAFQVALLLRFLCFFCGWSLFCQSRYLLLKIRIRDSNSNFKFRIRNDEFRIMGRRLRRCAKEMLKKS